MTRRARAPLAVRGAGLALAAVVAALVALQVSWIARHHEALRPIGPGDVAPLFALQRLDAPGTVELAGLRGQIVLVDFWATWCGPCRASMPAIERVYRRYRDRGLTVVSVNTEGQGHAREAMRFARRLGLTFPVVVDDGLTSSRYKVSAIPHLVLIDQQGVVRWVHRGLDSADALESELANRVDRLLDGPN